MNYNLSVKDLKSFIRGIKRKIAKNLPKDKQKSVLVAMVKISEEVGELSDAILHYLKHQRVEKLDHTLEDNTEGEIADVILATFMLAQEMNIDVEKALKDKMAILEKRTF